MESRRGFSKDPLDAVPLRNGIPGAVIQSGRMACLPIFLLPMRRRPFRTKPWRAVDRSVLSLPLAAYDNVLGAITFGGVDKNAFTEEDVKIAQSFATHLALSHRSLAPISGARSTQPGSHRGTRTADGDQQGPGGDLELTHRRPAGVRYDRRQCRTSVPRSVLRRVSVRRRVDPPHQHFRYYRHRVAAISRHLPEAAGGRQRHEPRDSERQHCPHPGCRSRTGYNQGVLKRLYPGLANESSSISTCVERVARRFRLHGTCRGSAQGCRGLPRSNRSCQRMVGDGESHWLDS